MMNRLVVCCTTGSVLGSESARLIRETGIGYCYEEAGGESAYQGLKRYVRSLWDGFAKGESTPLEACRDAVDKYAYDYVAQRFDELIRAR